MVGDCRGPVLAGESSSVGVQVVEWPALNPTHLTSDSITLHHIVKLSGASLVGGKLEQAMLSGGESNYTVVHLL